MSEVGRNAPCPCGSGLKHKRCCLHREAEAVLDALEAERVWGRMQSWALERFGDELGSALKSHMDTRGVGGEDRPANDEDLSLALCWLLIDRELAGGGTPASMYSRLPDLADAERGMASRIAASRLGLHRVSDVQPGEWIELESVFGGARVRAASPNVSRDAVRWHVLLCRVMEGGPAQSLWGAAAFYEPAEERELLAELTRIADEQGLDSLEAALLAGTGELVCFTPPSRSAAKVPYTLEGDPVEIAQASWRVRDPDAAFGALRAVGELTVDGEDDDGGSVSFEWLASRRHLLARRRALPVGAVCMESGPVRMSEAGELDADDSTSLCTFTLYADRLEAFAFSRARIESAVALIEPHLRESVTEPTLSVQSVDEARSRLNAERAVPPTHAEHAHTPAPQARGARQAEELPPASDRQMWELTYRRWLDDPNQHLDGLSPRQAAARREHRDELELQLRSIEHQSARARDDRRPGADIAWLRAELAQTDRSLAA